MISALGWLGIVFGVLAVFVGVCLLVGYFYMRKKLGGKDLFSRVGEQFMKKPGIKEAELVSDETIPSIKK